MFLRYGINRNTIQVTVVAYCTIMCPVRRSVLNFVHFLKISKTMFQIKAIRSEVIAHAADEPMLSSASFAAFSPKYGSITAAFN